MRHLHSSDIVDTSRRGRTLEQFLGGDRDSGRLRWVELRPPEAGVEIRLFEDENPSKQLDIYDLGEIDEPIATLPIPEALAYAQSQFGASPSKWVNQGVAVSEYEDFLNGRVPCLTRC